MPPEQIRELREIVVQSALGLAVGETSRSRCQTRRPDPGWPGSFQQDLGSERPERLVSASVCERSVRVNLRPCCWNPR
jgi:hypothetical protein